jgi:hypothetical protein
MTQLPKTPVSLGSWLSAGRAKAWCRVLLVGEAFWLAAFFGRAFAAKHPASILISSDFTCFWSAAILTIRSGAQAAYDQVAISGVEHAVREIGANLVAPFLYPPTYLFICLPLALLPFMLAAPAFVAASAAPFLLCLRRLLPQRWAVLPIVAFPGLMVTAGSEQNGFLSAACFGGGALLLDKKPFWAGACLGLLTVKPHFSVLVPVGLIAARRWRALAGAAASACSLVALSLLCFGTAPWLRFPQATRTALDVLTGDLTDLSKMQSVLGSALILHAPVALGFAGQAMAAMFAVAVLVATAWRRPGGRAEIAVLAASTLVASPYLMDYDLAILGIPLAWMMQAANEEPNVTCWRPWEKYIALAAYLMPLLTRGIALHSGIPLAPPVLVLLLLAVVARANNPVRLTGPGTLQPCFI